jgi:hypothetical protein
MTEPRLAATFFIQPSLDAPLWPLGLQGGNGPIRAQTYGQWKEQKYGRYFKKKDKQSSHA